MLDFYFDDDLAEVAFGNAGGMAVFGEEDGKFARLHVDVGRGFVGKEGDVFLGVVGCGGLFQFVGGFPAHGLDGGQRHLYVDVFVMGFHAGRFFGLAGGLGYRDVEFVAVEDDFAGGYGAEIGGFDIVKGFFEKRVQRLYRGGVFQ